MEHNIQRWLRQWLQLNNTHRFAFEQGQLWVIGPSYPQLDKNETRLVHNFRRLPEAAHVDGYGQCEAIHPPKSGWPGFNNKT
ncbi:MAG: hypothetical protein KC426_09870 [Oceanospirillaceae bacterium]|nr:hypothetical protein [Oceanospirillaceae bacterium]